MPLFRLETGCKTAPASLSKIEVQWVVNSVYIALHGI